MKATLVKDWVGERVERLRLPVDEKLESWLARLSGVATVRRGDVGRATSAAHRAYSLDDTFLRLGKEDALTIRDGNEHFLALAETGGGKTSLLRVLLGQYMRLGYGGLICTYKSDDASRAVEIARETGREDALIVVTPDGPWRCGVLDYELSRPPDAGGGLVENATALLMEVISNNAPGGQRQSKEPIWDESAARMIRHSMQILIQAGLPVTMRGIKSVIDGIPGPPAPGGDALVWPAGSFLLTCLGKAQAQSRNAEALQACIDFFTRELTHPGGARFVASVVATFQNATDVFQSGPVQKLFFTDTTFTPAASRRGAIIVLAMPVEWGAVGRSAQLLFKAAWIKEVLRRQGLPAGERPVFFVCDEYQTLATPLDALLMQAGRSSWVSACCLTQNIPNLYAAMEPGRAHDVVDSMIGNFGTVILGRNKCKVTNSWASETINKSLLRRWNGGASYTEGANVGWNNGRSGNASGGPSSTGWSAGTSGGRSWSGSVNSGWREEKDFVVPPDVFLRLSGGGPPDWQVETILLKAGKQFKANGGRPYMGVSWRQRH